MTTLWEDEAGLGIGLRCAMTESHFSQNHGSGLVCPTSRIVASLDFLVRSQAIRAKAIFRIYAKTTAAPVRVACRRIQRRIYEVLEASFGVHKNMPCR
jgi:hypothetical protein